MKVSDFNKQIHFLKCDSRWWQAVVLRLKLFELRENDRGFNVGDILVLEETSSNKYTGRKCAVIVETMVSDNDGPWLAKGHVALGIRLLQVHSPIEEVINAK